MRKLFLFLCAALMSVGMFAKVTPKGTDVWDETTKTLTVNSNPEDYAYWGESDIENLVISDAVTSIGVSAFEECSALTSVTIGNSVTSIGTSAFSSCYLLTSVEIPNSVEEIGVQAFASCSELTSVTIGNGVTSIGDYAFVDCSGLETVTINAESLESYGTDAFEGTAEDLTIYVPAGSVDTYKAAWTVYADRIEAIGGGSAATVVTITQNDFPGMDVSFTKDGVTVSADWIDNMQSGNLVAPGSFSTTLGNFTKIEVNAGEIGSLGEGWSGNSERQTWTGNASSVSFSGDISGLGHGITIMFTIEPAKYYLVGDMNGWNEDDAYLLTLNEAAEGVEYMITLDLKTTNQFKVKSGDIWYPDGVNNNYGQNGEIAADGNYTIYFRPNGDGGDDWFSHVLYVAKNESASAEKTIVVFEANGNRKEVEVEAFPHDFSCSYSNKDGELDAIIKELYEISAGHCSDDNYPVASGNEAVVAGSNGYDNYITISAAFEGTATVSGWYWNSDAYDGDGDWMDYTLTISIKSSSTPTAVENLQSDKVQSTKTFRNGQLLIMRDGKIYNVPGAKLR